MQQRPSAALQASLRAAADRLLHQESETLVLAALRATGRDFNRGIAVEQVARGMEGANLSAIARFVAVGDPVICPRNRYEDGLVNGLMGRVVALEPFTVLWDGEVEPAPVPPL